MRFVFSRHNNGVKMYGIIKSDDRVYKGDKIRFDCSKSFFDVGEVAHTTSHELSFDAGVTWLNITAKQYGEKVYASTGAQTVTLRLTKVGTPNVTALFTKSITVLDLATAKLFSTDSDLYQYEQMIDDLMPPKWSSWNLVHLRAQSFIIDWLDERGYRTKSGAKYTVDDLIHREELNQFSIAKVLEMIYESNINLIGDLSTQKRDKYEKLSSEKSSRFILTLDYLELNDDTNAAKQSTNMHIINVSR